MSTTHPSTFPLNGYYLYSTTTEDATFPDPVLCDGDDCRAKQDYTRDGRDYGWIPANTECVVVEFRRSDQDPEGENVATLAFCRSCAGPKGAAR
jgi:hypothetical protein